MTDPICPWCGRPIHDSAYLCSPCGTLVADELVQAANVVDEIETTIARLARIGAGTTHPPTPNPEPVHVERRAGLAWLRSNEARSALLANPTPVNLAASHRYHAAVNAIDTTARMIADERGHALPPPCQHRSCGTIRAGQAIGPVHLGPLEATIRWLAGKDQLDWLRHRVDAVQRITELSAAASSLVRIVDRPPSKVVVGQCGCGSYLYANKGAATVRCRGCGAAYDVDSSRADLRAALGDRLLTAAEIGRLAVYMNLATDQHKIRKRVTAWGLRGMLDQHDVKGEPMYRFGDAVDRIARHDEAS